MAIDVSKKAWLAELVRRKLDDYNPDVARSRLPPEVGDPCPEETHLEERVRALTVRSLRRHAGVDPGKGDLAAAFLIPFEEQIDLVLDLALVYGRPFEVERRRAEIAALFAAVTGELRAALAADPSRPQGASASTTRKALFRAGAILRKQYYPPGDPALGLSLYSGTLAIQRHQLARVAKAYYEAGRLEREVVLRELERASDETVLLVEALAGLLWAEGPVTSDRRRILKRQVSRLRLPKNVNRAANRAILSSHPPSFGDRVVERVAAAVSQNIEAIVTEVRETSEMGQLLAQAAAGKTLTVEEKQKVKAQLIDLAKAVPALAILAAPGGLFLLPLLAKVLPFNMLPNAWRDKDKDEPPGGSGTPPGSSEM